MSANLWLATARAEIADTYFVPFAKSRKAIIICVRPSVRMEQLGSHGADFHEIWYLSVFRELVHLIQVSLKSDKNNRYFTWRPIYIFDHISLISS